MCFLQGASWSTPAFAELGKLPPSCKPELTACPAHSPLDEMSPAMARRPGHSASPPLLES